MRHERVQHLRIRGLSAPNRTRIGAWLRLRCLRLHEDVVVTAEEAQRVLRLSLRDRISCVLAQESILTVCVGFDYYLIVATTHSMEWAVPELERLGLFMKSIDADLA